MKEGIHPKYQDVKFQCACGNIIETRSTRKGTVKVDICSACHPFFTGREKLVDSARIYASACGAGAVAAAVAAAKQLGAEKGYLLAHTTSAEVMADKFGQQASDSVGYAGIVFG